jgi:hypothetical protein
LFESIGFFDLKCYGLMESDDEELRGIEYKWKNIIPNINIGE